MAHILDINVPEEKPTGAPGGDYLDIKSTPQMFGGLTAQAQEKLGTGIEAAGVAGMDVAIQRAHIANELYANDAAVPGMKRFTDSWSKLNTLEGKGAVDHLPQFNEEIEHSYRDTLDAAPNLQAKQLLSNTMRRMADYYLRSGQSYADGQQKKWVDASSKDAASEFYNQAALARDDPAHMELLLRSGDQKMRDWGELRGLDEPSINRAMTTARSSALKTIIETVGVGTGGQLGEPQRAAAMLEHYQAQMTAQDILAVGSNLRGKLEDARARGMVDMLMGKVAPPGSAPSGMQPIPSVPLRSLPQDANAAVDNAAKATGLDAGLLRTIARIESGGRATATTGSYRGLFQLSNDEFTRYGGGNIYSAGDNAMAAARKLKAESDHFEEVFGQKPDPWQLYLVHQQGWGGFTAHMANPNAPAWINMLSTAEGQQKGERWAKAAIWGNIADDDKRRFGSVDNVTSGQFMNYWQAKVGRFGSALPTDFAPPEGYAPERADKSEVFGRAARMMTGFNVPPRVQDKVFAGINHEFGVYDSMNRTERDDLQHNVGNWIAAAENGVEGLTIPEDRIRAVFPPNVAQRMIEEFNIAQNVGTTIRGMQWASPQEVESARKDIESGQGLLSERLRAHAKRATTGPGIAEPEADTEGQAMYFRLRAGAGRQLERALSQRDALLIGEHADPAEYAKTNPAVLTARATADKSPEQFNAYATAQLAVQGQLGVPEDMRHVLTRGQAMGLTQAVAKGDPAVLFGQMQQRYGAAWPAVFRDLVTLGKMPSTYQAVAALADESTLNNPQAAATLSRWINETTKEKTATDILGADITGAIRKDIRGNADIQSYMRSLRDSGLSTTQIAGVLDGIEGLAQAYKFENKSDNATIDAVKAFTDKLRFMPDGGARVPATAYDTVAANARGRIEGLTAENVMMPTGARAQEWLDLLKSKPTWVTSPRGDGIWLKDGGGRFVHDDAGHPIEVKFNEPLQPWGVRERGAMGSAPGIE